MLAAKSVKSLSSGKQTLGCTNPRNFMPFPRCENEMRRFISLWYSGEFLHPYPIFSLGYDSFSLKLIKWCETERWSFDLWSPIGSSNGRDDSELSKMAIEIHHAIFLSAFLHFLVPAGWSLHSPVSHSSSFIYHLHFSLRYINLFSKTI